VFGSANQGLVFKRLRQSKFASC